jgi:probable HAF family extracellular repeat protein
MEDLGTLGGIESLGVGINRVADVTGWLTLSHSGSPRAFIYAGGVVRMLGDLGGATSYGTAINDVGQVAGTAHVVGGSRHAFLYADSVMRDLGTLGGRDSEGSSINAKGDVTGGSAIAEDSSYHAFLYTNGKMHDLNALVISGLAGFTLFAAPGINDQGQVVASGCDAETCRVFRLDVVPNTPQAIEYHHATFDHYFLTALPDEIAKLDSGIISGWVRTGQSFGVYFETSKATSPVCRFFSTAFGPKSSHFYTADAGECAKVQSNRDWQFEGLVFNVETPDLNGACPPSTQPVYRLYNNGQGAAPNHRFTTSLATRAQMIAAGWVSEGAGQSGVAMCSPV